VALELHAGESPSRTPGLVALLTQFPLMSAAIVGVCVLLGAGLALVGGGDTSASARIALRDPRGVVREPGTSAADLPRYTAERAAFARSQGVRERAAEILGDIDATELSNMVGASSSAESDAFVITATASSRARAVEIANAMVEAYRDTSEQQTTRNTERLLEPVEQHIAEQEQVIAGAPATPVGDSQRQAAVDTLTALRLNATEIESRAASFGDGVAFVDPAEDDGSGTGLGTALLRNMFVGGVFGLLLALAAAWMRSTRIGNPADSRYPGEILRSPLLGEVQQKRLYDLDGAGVRALPTVDYQFLASSLPADLRSGVVLIAGVRPGDGATSTTLNLAAAAALEGRRVVVVEADPRGDKVNTVLGIDPMSLGFTDLVRDGLDLRRPAVHAVAQMPQMAFIGFGSPVADSANLFRAPGCGEILRRLRQEFDVVFIDCPPLQSQAETAALAVHADALLLVLRRGTPRSVLEGVGRRVERFSVKLTGYVVTHAATRTPHL
jgi:Mrp family chromosome partitioning ATPase